MYLQQVDGHLIICQFLVILTITHFAFGSYLRLELDYKDGQHGSQKCLYRISNL